MTQFSCYACHGLIVTWPVDDLAEWLNANTPDGVHFNTVGGADPQVYAGSITESVEKDIQAGKQVIFVSHSMGSMLAYYLADDLKAAGLKAPLFIPIDPTDWGSNLPGTLRWGWSIEDGGRWAAPDNISKWINYHQPSYPGGGVCISGGTDIQVAGVDHLTIVNCPIVRNGVLTAVRSAIGA